MNLLSKLSFLTIALSCMIHTSCLQERSPKQLLTVNDEDGNQLAAFYRAELVLVNGKQYFKVVGDEQKQLAELTKKLNGRRVVFDMGDELQKQIHIQEVTENGMIQLPSDDDKTETEEANPEGELAKALPNSIEAEKAVSVRDPNTWSSKDGRTVEGRGLHCSVEGITIRSKNGSELLLPYALLSLQDSRRGIETLPFFTNDDVRMSAKSVGMSKSVTEGESDSFEGEGDEEVTLSGRDVEVSMSSPKGGGRISLEIFMVSGNGKNKSIGGRQKGIYDFEKFGSKIIFKGEQIQDFKGWVVLARSLNTGKIIDTASSLSYLEKFILERATEQVEFDEEDLQSELQKEKLLEALQ